jgi:CubicO group peptidase (beta-lactamase class C family)
MRDAYDAAAQIILEAILHRAFPAASVEVGCRAGPLWRRAFGTLTYDPDARETAEDTVFDLASLTKVIATATLVMRAVDARELALDEPVSARMPEWRGADREAVTIRDLLTHASGLTAYLPFFRDHTGRADFERSICRLPLEYEPRTQSVYSDLGFILLGFILEDIRGSLSGAGRLDTSATLTEQFRRIASFITAEPLAFKPPRPWRERTAPTELDPWRGRMLLGEVHDENAWALGGAAGHAGLFGTAASVGAFARAVLSTLGAEGGLAHPATLGAFIRPAGIPGSSRALAWDTMLPSSSCGTLMSSSSVGHTGFTGTSLWIDWERDRYVVLLTNRVHPTRENDAIRAVRPRFHDAVLAETGPT